MTVGLVYPQQAAELLQHEHLPLSRPATFRSDDGGAHWHDVDGGRLPDVPHHAVVVSLDDRRSVYVAKDASVYVSPDLGGTWSSLKRNLPNTMCVDLVFRQSAGTLTVATYVRSIWRLKVRL